MLSYTRAVEGDLSAVEPYLHPATKGSASLRDFWTSRLEGESPVAAVKIVEEKIRGEGGGAQLA